MNQTIKSVGKWGGSRPGSGRPKGSSNKIKIEDLIDSIESRAGVSFTEQVAMNYMGAIQREDWGRVENYDKALLNKIVADKSEITVEEFGDLAETKRLAFLEALNHMTNINKHNPGDDDASD